jgi:hypothetical protein
MQMIRETIEKLLQGEFICPISDPKAFKDLQDPETRKIIDNTLLILNRKISTTSNQGAYFAIWNNVKDYERNKVSSEFNLLRNQIRHIIEFILLIMDANMRDNPLLSGEQISKAELTLQVEKNSSLEDRLNNLIILLNAKKKVNNVAQNITTLLETLEKYNVIIETIKGSGVYLTTGKIEYIYDVIDFIYAHDKKFQESLSVDEKHLNEEIFND